MKKLVYFLLLSFFLLDSGYSFLQFYNTPFDGDMAGGIVPAEHVLPVLNNPLGYEVLMADEPYANPNRFFSHWSFYTYFNKIPPLVSNYIDPITAAYISAAFAKTAIQISLILLLVILVSGSLKIFRIHFMLYVILIFPFFQTNGYRSYMGIIDHSTTYTFFYALPLAFLMLYFLPFILMEFYNKELKGIKLIGILWIPLALLTSLSGPLNPGVALIICLLVFCHRLFRKSSQLTINRPLNKIKVGILTLPKHYYYFLLPISLFSLYSLFIGSYNSINTEFSLDLIKQYSRLPNGLLNQFFQKLGFPILFLVLVLNSLLIQIQFKNVGGAKILMLFKWIGLFSVIYILLLPLGGYREYRPNILRYDTILPITIALICVFAKSSLFLLRHFEKEHRVIYSSGIILVLLVFTNADKAEFGSNDCERKALETISDSKESQIEVVGKCTVLSWEAIDEYSDSELNAELLLIWDIIEVKKVYRTKP